MARKPYRAIRPGHLALLATAHEIEETIAIADGSRWWVAVRVGIERKAVGTEEGAPRYWSSLDEVAAFLHGHRITQWSVDASTWRPGRPDPAKE